MVSPVYRYIHSCDESDLVNWFCSSLPGLEGNISAGDP